MADDLLITEDIAVLMNGYDKMLLLLRRSPPWEDRENLKFGIESHRRAMIRMGILVQNCLEGKSSSVEYVKVTETAILMAWPTSPLNDGWLYAPESPHEA